MTFNLLHATLFCILIFRENDAVEVAADEVAEDNADVDCQDVEGIGHPEIKRNAEIVEGIGDAVGESANDEERDTEKEGQILFLTGELHCSGHNESAADAEKSASEGTCSKSEFKNLLSSLLNGQRCDASQERGKETADDIAQKYQEKCSDFVLLYESCRTRVKSELVTDYCKESEGEQDRSDE